MNSIKAGTGKKHRADEVFYQLGKVAWLPFCIAGFWFAHGGYDRYGELAACSIRRACGFPCPGCGGTRAFYYLFCGEFAKSFRLNPIVIYGVLAYLHFMLLYFCRKHMGRAGKGNQAGVLSVWRYCCAVGSVGGENHKYCGEYPAAYLQFLTAALLPKTAQQALQGGYFT